MYHHALCRMEKESKPRRKPRNYVLAGGVMRFSKARMYKKRALYRPSVKKARSQYKKPQKKIETRMIKKEIGGEKNGGYRIVRKNKMVCKNLARCFLYILFYSLFLSIVLLCLIYYLELVGTVRNLFQNRS